MSEPGMEELSPLKRAIVEIRDLKAKVRAADQRRHEPIALVGMGMRFPGGVTDADSFWHLLVEGRDAITEVPPERWDVDAWYDADPDAPGRTTARHGGFLRDVDLFDADFFGISRREAERMDPQQRLLLEVAWEALEHAGIPADDLFGTRAGVFVGISNSDYFRMLLDDPGSIDAYTTTGNTFSIAAGRLSYVLGVEGPSIALDTACSSSLVTVHLAVQSLRRGECDLALAGGVSAILTPELTVNFSHARMLAADGRCKTFDAAADGYVRSEGCALVALKRLSDALADGDDVLAVIRGSAVTQDGRSGGLTAPNGPAQQRVIEDALRDARTAPAAVGYLEAHGTGTPLGDPIELRAAAAALGAGRPDADPLLVGSLKTNVGHMEAAAGIGGLIKAALMVRRGMVVPHLHLTTLHPHLAAEHLPVRIPTAAAHWVAPEGGRVAGVSSFGLSGTNAHVIVGQAPARTPEDPPTAAGPGVVSILTLSARSDAALHDACGALIDHLRRYPDEAVGDVARTLALGRSHHAHRLAAVAADADDALARLQAFAGGDSSAVVAGVAASAPPAVAFVFTGHGSQRPGMGRELYAHEPVFRAAIDRCADLLHGTLPADVRDVLFGDGAGLESMATGQPALFAFEYALAQLWSSWGVEPSFVAGHSAGEYVAAVVAGVMSLEDGLRLICARGRLMASLAEPGEMAALFTVEDEVAPVVARRAGDVGIAAVNTPTTTVISGRPAAVRAVIDELGLDTGEWRALDISIAAHSPLVEPVLDEFEAEAATVALSPPRIALVSSLTGELGGDEVTTSGYWRRHLREPVRFADVLESLRAAGCTVFVELGPHPTLVGFAQRMWPDTASTMVPSTRDGEPERRTIATAAAALHVAGVTLDWRGYHRGTHHPHVQLPTYPWQRERFWSSAAGGAPKPAAADVWAAASAAASVQSESGPFDLDIARYPRRWALLDGIAGAYIVEALGRLGLFGTAGEVRRADDLVADGTVAASYGRLLDRWFRYLVQLGLLDARDDGSVSCAQPLPARDGSAMVAAAAAEFAGIEPLLRYVATCGDRLAAVVSGQDSALTTLFPDGSYEVADFLYRDWAVSRYFNGIVRAAAVAASTASRGPARILEVGAGTGGTAAFLLPALPPDRTEYSFTDVSEFFLRRAEERFTAHPFVRYALLDIEHDPQQQGFPEAGFDVVVAANVLHATRDLRATARHLRALLAPGGVLVAYEATEHPHWFDVTTALIEGWQRFEDGLRGDHPLLTPEQWQGVLGPAGFDEIVALPGPDAPTTVLGQHVVLARADGVATAGSVAVAGVARAAGGATAPVAPVPAAAEIADELAAALPGERMEVLVRFVRACIGYVLRAPDPDRIDRAKPLLDLGFDSLMAVELRDRLRAGLRIERKLPATLVFDHPNVAALAAYLDTLLHAAESGSEPASSPTEPVVPTSTTSAADLAQMSEEEVERMLIQKLAEI